MDEFKSEVLAREYIRNSKEKDVVINQSVDISSLQLLNTNVGNNDYN